MDDFPDPDEEFELMYQDELELLKEQDNFEDEELNIMPTPVRKSLNFDTPSKQTSTKTKSATLNSSFDSCFKELQDVTNLDGDNQSKADVTSKKRPADAVDLFGDITDLENVPDSFWEDLNPSKRHKAEKEKDEDLELIDYIVQRRLENKKNQTLSSVPLSGLISFQNKSDRDKFNLSASVPKYPFIKLKSFDGDFVYVRFHSEDFEKEETHRMLQANSFQGLMGESFKNVWNEANKLLNQEYEDTSLVEVNNDIEMLESDKQDKQLWVDLYKPKKYLELLSDEGTNRTMLRWMKLWDKVVFHRNPKIKVPKADKPFQSRFKMFELNTDLDEHGRPYHKVALLCGPPGLGKTTLAHMVAKHAGYNVVEINASDDRSIEAFRNTLENATQMRSVVDQQKRPNCIVFDEIDGAPAASIDFLVKFISGNVAVKAKKSSKNKEKQHHILKRPIICICNDGYAPALRPLKQIAFVINFPQTSTARLAERLMEIARRQQIKTDVGAMMALAEKSNHDIRSCLSVLHFFKAQNKPIGLTDIHKASVGQKDMQKGLFAVWSDIFEIKRSKNVNGTMVLPTMKERMQNVLNVMFSFGDHERVAQGVYENFPKLQIKEKNLEGIAHALDWFCFNDLLTKYIYSEQNYSLTSYLNYAFVVWHFTFATTQKQKLNYPSAGYEFRTKQTRQKGIVTELLKGMPPSVRCYQAALPLIMDVLPLLLGIISPPLRPVSLHLYTEEERTNLLRVASIMADYNLNYIQERKPDGAYEFNLEPNVEELVVFDKKSSTLAKVSYPNRQLIAREIEMEKMRRLEAHTVGAYTGKGKPSEKVRKEDNASDAQKALPNHLQTLKFKELKSNLKAPKAPVRKDFFGRIVQKPESSEKVASVSLTNDIWFQYKEGYSNAVKKKIKVKELR